MKHKKGDSMKTVILRLLVIVSVMGCIVIGNAWAQEMGAVNINTVTAEELATLPGIDENLAQNIVAFRSANGPFATADDLLKVEGMDSGKLDAIRDLVTLGEESAPMQTPEAPSGE